MARTNSSTGGGSSGVTSLNGLMGALSLIAGTGIDIVSSGSGITITNTGTNVPALPFTSVQYNDSGAFGGDALFTYNAGAQQLSVPQVNVHFLNTSGASTAINVNTRTLLSDLGTSVMIWSSTQLSLINNSGNHVLNWGFSYLVDNGGTVSLDWNNRFFRDSSGNINFEYSNGIHVNNAYYLPATDGLANYVLITDGAGNTSFVDSSTLPASTPILTLNQIAVGDSSNLMTSYSDFVYNISSSIFAVAFIGTPYLVVDAGGGAYFLGNSVGANITINDTGATSVVLSGNFVYAQNSSGIRYMELGGGFYNIGDLSGSNNASKLSINDSARTLTYTDKVGALGTYLNIDPTNPLFQFGDISGLNFADYIEIGKDRFTFFGKVGGNRSLEFNEGIIYTIGDVDSAYAGSMFVIDDAARLIYTVSKNGFQTRDLSGNVSMNVDSSAFIVTLGDVSAAQNKTTLVVDDSNQIMYWNQAGQNYLSLDRVSGVYGIGDLSGSGNANQITIEDAGNLIRITAPSLIIMQSPLTGVSTIFVNMVSNQVTISQAYTMDNTVGLPGYVFTTDGAGAATWQPAPTATIGVPVIGGVPYDVLYIDGSGNLAQNADFTYNPDFGVLQFKVGFLSDNKFILDEQFGFYSMGSQPGNSSGFDSRIVVNDGGQNVYSHSSIFHVENPATNVFFNVDMGSSFAVIGMGDLDNVGRSTQFVLDDNLQSMTALLEGDFIIQNHFSGQGFRVNGASQTVTISGAYSLPTSAGSLGEVLTAGFGGTTNWLPAPTASIGIGTTITGSTPWEVLFVDASSQLAQDTGFIFQPVPGGTHPFTFHISLNSTNIFDLNNTTGTAKIGNYSGGGVGAAYAVFDWGTTGNTTFSQFGTFFVKDILGNESFSVKISTNTVKISNAYTLPIGAIPLNGLMTLTGAGVATWQLLATASIASNAVTYAKIQQVGASRILGNPTGSTANVSEIALSANLGFSGTTLVTNAFTGDVTTPAASFATTISANAVTYAKFQQVAAVSLVGNPTGSTANAQGITLGAGLSFVGTTLVNTVAAPTLTSTQIAFGNTSNLITSSSSFTYNDTAGSRLFNVSLNSNPYLQIDQTNGRIKIGDINATSNKVWIDLRPTFNNTIFYSGNQFQVQAGTNQMLSLDNQFWQYSIGDISGANHSTYLNVSDLNKQFSMSSGGHLMFNADWANSIYGLGDVSSGNNGTRIIIDDTTANESIALYAGKSISLRDATGHHFIDVNPVAQKVIIGDISGTGSGNQFQLDFVTNINTSFSTGFLVRWSGVNYLNIDANAFVYQMGDIGGSNNHTYIEINDATQLMKLTNVPTFANDAAATGAGLVTGQLYKTTTLGTTALNIVP